MFRHNSSSGAPTHLSRPSQAPYTAESIVASRQRRERELSEQGGPEPANNALASELGGIVRRFRTGRATDTLAAVAAVAAACAALAVIAVNAHPSHQLASVDPTASAQTATPNSLLGPALEERGSQNNSSPQSQLNTTRTAAAPDIVRQVPPEKLAAASNTRFLAALPIADRLFILHDVERGASRVGGHTETNRLSNNRSTFVTPLAQGNFLLVQDRGPAERSSYTLVNPAGSCWVTSSRTVALQLDSGEPEAHSELGPVWLADEVSGCGLVMRSGVPAVAVAGTETVKTGPATAQVRNPRERGLPRRVIAQEETADCNAAAGEFVEAILELRGLEYALLRSADSIDWIGVRPVVQNRQQRSLSVNTSLYWDQEVDAC